MGFVDHVTRTAARIGFELAADLIGAVGRRDGSGARRTPDHLLVADSSGRPGPALSAALADYDMVLPAAEIDPARAEKLAVEAGKIALRAASGRLQKAARRLLGERSGRGAAGVDDWPAEEAAEEVAWERLVAAVETVADLRVVYEIVPDELVAMYLRQAELELEDALAVAGEVEVRKIRRLLA